MTGQSMRLADLLLTTKDGDWGSDERAPEHSPFYVIRGADFPEARERRVDRVPLRYLPDKTVHRRTLVANDILLETAGGTPDRPTGRTLLVTQDLLDQFDSPVTCASFARFLRADPALVDPGYLFWYLQAIYAAGETFEYQVQHTGVARFQYTAFAQNKQIPLPCVSQQQGIAEVLGAFDDKIAANTNLANSLARLAESHFTALRWSTEFPISAISRLVDTQYGLTASACQGGGPRFLRVTDINKKPWVDWDGAPACEINESDWRKYRLVAGDILVARMADPGKAAFVDPGDPDAVFASYLVRLKAHDPTQALYIYYFLRSPEYWQYAEGAMTGSVQKNMNAKVIVATDISMPNGTDLGPFNRTVGAFRASMRATLVESHRLAAMRDALLPQLMSGKIRVKDAEQMLGDVV